MRQAGIGPREVSVIAKQNIKFDLFLGLRRSILGTQWAFKKKRGEHTTSK